jgi:hypothetical protein
LVPYTHVQAVIDVDAAALEALIVAASSLYVPEGVSREGGGAHGDWAPAASPAGFLTPLPPGVVRMSQAMPLAGQLMIYGDPQNRQVGFLTDQRVVGG